jgi:transposase InsO family protein
MRRARKAAVSIRSVQHARAVLVAWRHDYNEQRPHSKLGWMTPGAYASALSGTLRLAGAPRPDLLPPIKQKAQINSRLSLPLDEKRESRH